MGKQSTQRITLWLIGEVLLLVGCCEAISVSFNFTFSVQSLPLSEDFSGTAATIKTCTGIDVANVTTNFAEAAEDWKRGAVGSSVGGLQTYIKYACACDSSWRCFETSNQVYGDIQFNELWPFVSAFSRNVTIGQTFFVESLKGMVVPGTKGGKHNGCIRMDDKRYNLASNEISLWAGFKAHEISLLSSIPEKVLKATYDNSLPCTPVMFDVAVPGAASACKSPGCSGCLRGGASCQTCLRGYTGASTGCITCESGFILDAATGACLPQCESAGCLGCNLPNRCWACATGFSDPLHGCRNCDQGIYPSCVLPALGSSDAPNYISSDAPLDHVSSSEKAHYFSSSDDKVIPVASSSDAPAGASSSEKAHYFSSSEAKVLGNCSSANCQLPACKCSSTTTPGSLAASDVPQFIIVSFDDAVSVDEWNNAIYPLLNNGHVDSAACPLRATLFASNSWTDYHVFQMAHVRGCEIGVHTFTHETGSNTTYDVWMRELETSRSCLSKLALVSESSITGFRAPKLEWNSDLLDSLTDLGGFKYDSSMVNVWQLYQQWLWPGTLTFGVPVHAPWNELNTGEIDHSWPLWEMWMPDLVDASGGCFASMDYDAAKPDDASFAAALRRSFDLHYSTTRSPFLVALHAVLVTKSRLTALLDFFKYASALPNVHYATMSEVISWVQNPQGSSKIIAAGGMPGCITYKTTMANKVVEETETLCDGLDNDGDGQIDENVTTFCDYDTPSQKWMSFYTCGNCPASYDATIPCTSA